MAQRGRPRKGEVRPTQKEAPKHSLIKAFDEDRYLIFPWDGGYCLYDRQTPCQRANAAFLGKFYIDNSGRKYVFNDVYYDTAPQLIKAMEEWIGKQPFERSVYDPTCRINIRLYYAMFDYLQGIGFKHEKEIGYKNEDIFTLRDGYGDLICKILISIEQDTTKGFVTRVLDENKWQKAGFVDYESAFGALNSLIINHLLPMNAMLANVFKNMNSQRANEVFTHTLNIATLSTYVESSREETIEMLERELKKLKGE